MNFELHHIGYLTDSLQKAKHSFESVGYTALDAVYDNVQDIHIQFMKSGGTLIELIEPSTESKIFKLLDRYNNCFYHSAYKVNNIDEAFNFLKQNNSIRKLTDRIHSIYFKSDIQFFLMDGRMIELISI